MRGHRASSVPNSLRTERLLLRCWTPADAAALGAVLSADAARLAPWLPARVAAPAPLPELSGRLAGYAADFAAERAFRYALLDVEGHDGDGLAGRALLGGADLHPRNATGRVPLAEAECVELGYWLVAGAEGRGFAAEAARALLDVASSLPGLAHAEARIDDRNARSRALAQRLGFRYAGTESGIGVWRVELVDPASGERRRG